MTRLAIYGSGYLGIIKLIDAINRSRPRGTAFDVLGFINDRPDMQGKSVFGYPILGGREIIPELVRSGDVEFVHNINSSLDNRKKIASILEESRCRIASLIHPGVDMSYVQHGVGCCIEDGGSVGINAKIGRYLTCRPLCRIGHDSEVGDYVFVASGVTFCGLTRIGEGCFIGAGAVVRDRVTIGAGSVIGAGAAVVSDIPPRSLAYGNPARVIRRIRDDENLWP